MSRVRAIYYSICAKYGQAIPFNLNASQLLDAIEADESTQRSEIEKIKAEKGRRIAELEERLHVRGDVINAERRMLSERETRNKALEARIAELEEKRKELPPLPELIKAWSASLRHPSRLPILTSLEHEFVAWIDTHYPRHVPQWELDAQACEKAARGVSMPEKMQLLDIAARLREAHNGKE